MKWWSHRESNPDLEFRKLPCRQAGILSIELQDKSFQNFLPMKWWSHRESNPDLEFRKLLFYPLNYETTSSYRDILSIELRDQRTTRIQRTAKVAKLTP